jgi:tripartite-type tricarboxylate transporter receptor subunit TctC
MHAWLRSIAAVAALTGAVGASAQQFPTKPIRLIVPLAAGGPSDIMARTVANKLTENVGHTVIVDNRPGASAIIGTEITSKSPPDGYTIALVSNTISINPALFKKLPYDTLRDLAPVSLLVATPYILMVHPSMPVRSVKELISLAKARPGELNHASGGSGTGPHLAMELFMMRTGVKVVHITYKGGGPAMNDFLAGQTHVYLANMIAAYPQVRSGRARGLAVSSEQRSEVAPDLPTIAESGLPGFNEGGQHGIVAPGGTARALLDRLHQELAKAMHAPEVKTRVQAEGGRIVASTPDEYRSLIRSEMQKWTKVIAAAGISPL